MQINFDPNPLEVFKPMFDIPTGTVINIGGRGSGKSITTAKLVLTRLLTFPDARGLLIRDEAVRLKESILNDVKEVALEFDQLSNGYFSKFFQIQDNGIKNIQRNNDAVFTMGLNSSKNEQSARLKGLSKINFVIFEEAEDIRDKKKVRKLFDTLRRFKDHIVVFNMNVPDKDHWIIETHFNLKSSEYPGFCELEPKTSSILNNVHFFITTYKNNTRLLEDAVKQYEAYGNKDHPDYDLEHYCNQILGLVPMSSQDSSIVKRFNKESWRDDDDTTYTITHPFIQSQLAQDGYYFISFDGGMHTTHSAGILGYHVQDKRRDILLKEFYNKDRSHGMTEISSMVKEFCDEQNIDYTNARLYGDPSLDQCGDREFIESVLDNTVDLLYSLKSTEDVELKGIYVNRKEKRLGRLQTEISVTRSDNKPAVIILKNEGEDFGCPQAYKGLFSGFYKRAKKMTSQGPAIIKDLEQVPPVTDICDAYTYYLLATRPVVFAENDKIDPYQRFYNFAK